MIQAEGDPQRRDDYLQKLMELPNQVFAFMGQWRALYIGWILSHTDCICSDKCRGGLK